MKAESGGMKSEMAARTGFTFLLAMAPIASCGDARGGHAALRAEPILRRPVLPAVVATRAPREAALNLAGQRNAHLTAGQELAVLAALNRGEMDAAAAALPSLTSREARGFAQAMLTDHGAALQQVSLVADSLSAPPSPSALLEHTTRSGEQSVQELRGWAGHPADGAYMNSQVHMHQAALDLIDHQLLPDAGDSQLQGLLAAQRGVVAEHLQVAIQIRAKVAG